MKYFSLAAHNRELVLITDMESFAHYFCYTTKQKKGHVTESRDLEVPEDLEGARSLPAYEIDESAISDDDDL